MMMPGMDGFELAERIRQIPELADLTLIMISSGRAIRETRIAAGKLGIARYMTKPVLQSDLLDVILELTGEPRLVEAMLASAPATNQNLPKLKILLAEDGMVNQRVAVGFLENRGDAVA